MTRTTPLFLALAAASIGCADITYDSHELRRTIVHTERSVTPVGIRATFRQHGSLVEGEAERLCDAFEVKQIQRRMREEPRNKSLPGDLVGLAFGVGFAALGAGLVADARHVYADDRNGRLYNQTGPKAATAGGAVLLVTGAAIMTAPVIDLGRTVAAQSKETVDTIKENGPTTERQVPCGPTMTAAKERVTARVGSASFDLGAVDQHGRFSVDLVEKIPADKLHALGDPARMQLWVGSGNPGEVELSPPAVARDQPPDSEPAPKPPPQLAISPEDAAHAKGAVKSAKDACVRACAVACAGKAACADACAAEACK